MVECEDKVVGKMYPKVAFHYFKAILEVIFEMLSIVTCVGKRKEIVSIFFFMHNDFFFLKKNDRLRMDISDEIF
jgi:hypothetical protein